MAGEIRTAVLINDDEAAELDNEFEAVGAGHRVPTDPLVAVLEAFGCSGPAKDGNESIDTAFRIVLVGSLSENMSGGTTGFEVVLPVENGAQLADF